VPADPFHAGIDLPDLDGVKRAGVDVRCSSTALTLTISVGAERGCTTTVVEIFDPFEGFELAGAISHAAETMKRQRIAAGGPV
jgi:hypothetical protein